MLDFVIGLLLAFVWLPAGIVVRTIGLYGSVSIGNRTPRTRLLGPVIRLGDLLNLGSCGLSFLIGLVPLAATVIAVVLLFFDNWGSSRIWGLLVGSIIGVAVSIPYFYVLIFTTDQDPMSDWKALRARVRPPAPTNTPLRPDPLPNRIVRERPGINIAYVDGSFRSGHGPGRQGMFTNNDDRATFTALVVPVDRVADLEERTTSTIAATAHIPDSMYVTSELLSLLDDGPTEAIVVTCMAPAVNMSDAEAQRSACYRALLLALAESGVGAIVIAKSAGPGRQVHHELVGETITLRDNETRPFPILRLAEAAAWYLGINRRHPPRSGRPVRPRVTRTRTITVPSG